MKRDKKKANFGLNYYSSYFQISIVKIVRRMWLDQAYNRFNKTPADTVEELYKLHFE